MGEGERWEREAAWAEVKAALNRQRFARYGRTELVVLKLLVVDVLMCACVCLWQR